MSTTRQLHKFGGSSLADPDCYQRVASLLQTYSQPNDLVVVSAAGKTTNQLIAFIEGLSKQPEQALVTLQAIQDFQLDLIRQLLDGEIAQSCESQVKDECHQLANLAAPLLPHQSAAVLAHGELWSARLLAAYLNQQGMVAISKDARHFLRAQPGTHPEVNRHLSTPLLQETLAQHPHQRIIITGFIAQDEHQQTVLLGRNGSDYSATMIGAMADVERVTIWSDVAGVYSADPHVVENACLLPLLRLDEADELARLAAPVLHSRTLQPVAQSSIDLHLRCSYSPESGSTHIERVLASGRGAKILTSLDEVLLIELNFARGHDFERQFKSALSRLSQAQLSPLAFDVQADQSRLRLAYTAEIASGALCFLNDAGIEAETRLKEGFQLIAAVGAGVTKNATHSFGFYQQLKQEPVEFLFESESALSLVAILRKSDLTELVNRIHTQLFQAHKRVAIALCGKGNIGSNWLCLFAEQKAELEKRRGMAFELVSVISSKQYWLDEAGIDPHHVNTHFQEKAVHYDNHTWLDHLAQLHHMYDEIVIIDVTASQAVSDLYIEIANHGIHLISANKMAGSSDSDTYYRIQDAFKKVGRQWLYNATVGAGLPINHSLRDLRESGDEVVALSGIFSGTLSWLFQQYDGSVPFSQLVESAWQQGLTEPDPRNDLDGSDVMRKLLILAREAGLDIEPSDITVESLVPQELLPLSLDEFLDHGHILDAELAERLQHAQEDEKVLRYVARLEKTGQASVGVEALSSEHALANLLPCDNIFAIESKWYKDNPLVIRGPGAGREVTAGAIQSDLNLLSSRL